MTSSIKPPKIKRSFSLLVSPGVVDMPKIVTSLILALLDSRKVTFASGPVQTPNIL